ncbi:hypothetical protein C8R46DRAFT_1040586 [Mycena filopes]|nr:hypothetical protein C8R46DRAFT_1040586 [Mycena filopes]
MNFMMPRHEVQVSWWFVMNAMLNFMTGFMMCMGSVTPAAGSVTVDDIKSLYLEARVSRHTDAGSRGDCVNVDLIDTEDGSEPCTVSASQFHLAREVGELAIRFLPEVTIPAAQIPHPSCVSGFYSSLHSRSAGHDFLLTHVKPTSRPISKYRWRNSTVFSLIRAGHCVGPSAIAGSPSLLLLRREEAARSHRRPNRNNGVIAQRRRRQIRALLSSARSRAGWARQRSYLRAHEGVEKLIALAPHSLAPKYPLNAAAPRLAVRSSVLTASSPRTYSAPEHILQFIN